MPHKPNKITDHNLNSGSKKTYRARAPLRLGLAGGGTDVDPFSYEYGSYIVNATIDLYAQAILQPDNNGKIVFIAADIKESILLNSSNVILDDEPLRIHRAVYNRIVKQYNNGKPLSFKLITFADAPPGSGLGTSSTMIVCIIKVFDKWLGLNMQNYDIAQLAFDIERKDLGFAGGKQDQYSATFGGFNFIEFGPGESRVLVNPLSISEAMRIKLEISTVLFYCGKSRQSSIIIEEQILNIKRSLPSTLDAMHKIKDLTKDCKEALLQSNMALYVKTLQNSWISKKELSTKITNPSLDLIYNDIINTGALCGKISGAGGGGFFMFLVDPENRFSVIEKLNQYNGQVVNFHFTDKGAESWVEDHNLQ